MNSAMAAYSLRQYAEALTLLGGEEALSRAVAVTSFADAQRMAAAKAWSACPADGPAVKGWFLRAYLGNDKMGWRGQCGGDALPGQPAGGSMWTETQAWALLGGVPTIGNHTAELLHAIETLARDPSPIGAINVPPNAMADAGTSYGGVWPCGSQVLIQALGNAGQSSTFDEFKKNLLGTHSTVYPDIFFGTTSGPDVLNSVISPWPGSTRCEYQSPDGLDGHPSHGSCNELAFGLLNSWQHSLPLWSLGSLVGLEFDATGAMLVLALPSLPSFEISTSLFGVMRVRSTGQPTKYTGWWEPKGDKTTVALTLKLPSESCVTAIVNGASLSCEALRIGQDKVVLHGTLPLHWELVAKPRGNGV